MAFGNERIVLTRRGRKLAAVVPFEDLRRVMGTDSRAAIEQKTQVLNDVTRHLAEVLMNRCVRAALGGKKIDGM